MSAGALRAALAARLGDAALCESSTSIDGCAPPLRVEPGDGEALSEAVRVLAEQGAAALVRGGGTRMGLGNPPLRGDVLLSTRSLTGIDVLDSEDGVVHVAAGTQLTALQDAAREQGWELALDPFGEAATVGGVIAAAATGPRRQGWGAPRDCVLGLDVVLASGVRTRCGGRVVKNVTGYDLAKLYAGSLGTLGVIESAWLRLRPRAASRQVLCARLAPEADPFARATELARRSSARVAALVSPTLLGNERADAWTLVAEFAGDEPATQRDADWLRSELGGAPADESAISALRDFEGAAPTGDGLRARLVSLPSALAATCEPLRAAGATLCVHPGAGVVVATLHGEAEGLAGVSPSLSAAIGAVERAALASGSSALYESLPLAAKRQRDVFGAPDATLPLMRSLKQRFDPDGVFNPGRYAGRL